MSKDSSHAIKAIKIRNKIKIKSSSYLVSKATEKRLVLRNDLKTNK